MPGRRARDLALLSSTRPIAAKLTVVSTTEQTDPSPQEPPAIELRFAGSGAAYQRAKAVADRLGISVRDYLLRCIAEGHFVLSVRVTREDDLDTPAFERRGSIQSDIDVDEELRKLREETIRGSYLP